jgi:hypothetical protein
MYTSSDAPAVSTTPYSSQALTDINRTEKLQKGIEKAKGLYNRGVESGLFATLGGIFNKRKNKQQTGPAPAPVVAVAPEPENKNNTMKYVLIGGGVLALGLIVYFATRKSDSGK